jgi:hypothetical protein
MVKYGILTNDIKDPFIVRRIGFWFPWNKNKMRESDFCFNPCRGEECWGPEELVEWES